MRVVSTARGSWVVQVQVLHRFSGLGRYDEGGHSVRTPLHTHAIDSPSFHVTYLSVANFDDATAQMTAFHGLLGGHGVFHPVKVDESTLLAGQQSNRFHRAVLRERAEYVRLRQRRVQVAKPQRTRAPLIQEVLHGGVVMSSSGGGGGPR